MNKFERVLSDVDYMEILSKINGFSPTSDGEVYVGSGDDVWFALADFDEKVEQATIAAFKAQLAEQADMFWDVSNPEWSRESISCILLEDNEFDQSDVGKTIEFTRAKSLPNITVLITSYDEEEDEITWEVIENE